MTQSATTQAGIPGLGDITWGSHHCSFYASRDDLVETLVPYFQAGLASNDACLWVTSEPFRAEDARAALAAVVPDLRQREQRGQIEIVDHEDWYLRRGKHDPEAILEGWLRREEEALRRGYQGLRLTGNTWWLEREDWTSFIEYERLVNEGFRSRRILALCSYCSHRCSATDVFDVVANHQATIARRDGIWQVLESAELQLAREDLLRVQRAAETLRESARQKDAFIAMVGHELRNPLAPIATAVQIMKLGHATEFHRELDVMERQVRHLSRLVDDLLDVSRITRGRIELHRQVVEITQPIERAVERCSPLLEERGHGLVLDVPRSGLAVDGDLERLAQIVSNLLANAACYTPDGGRVEVRADGNDDTVRVRVRDDGPGIPDDVAAHAFEPFVQGSRTLDRKGGGLGLGLPIVRSLAELHGGTAAVTQAGSGGTEVTVTLPRAHTGSGAPAVPRGAAARQESRRVLIVDDNADAVMLMRMLLEQVGHVVEVAHDGSQALERAASFRPELALLDLGLPGMDGYELARRLERMPGLVGLKLVALTGYGAAEDRARGREAGFVEHLVKPVSLQTLLEVID